MRSPGAFVVAVAAATAVGVAVLFFPMIPNFESATDFGVTRKIADFVLVTGAIYLLLLVLVGVALALPFAMSLRVFRKWLSASRAAVTAGLVSSIAALVPLAALYAWVYEDAFAAVYRAFLPVTATCGLLGGLVFAFLHRDPQAYAP